MTISRQRLHKIEAIRDKDIDYSDIRNQCGILGGCGTPHASGQKGRVSASGSGRIGVTQGAGQGYQSRINAILRAYMETHQPSP